MANRQCFDRLHARACMRVQFIICLSLILFLNTQAAHAASPALLMQEIEYLKVKQDNAINITFNHAVRYLSHYPKNRGKEVNINLDLATPEQDPPRPRVQTFPPPQANTIPLLGAALMIEEKDKKLLLRFKRTVDFSVSQIKGTDSITVILHDAQVPLPGSEAPDAVPLVNSGPTIDDATVQKYMHAGRKELTKGNNEAAIQIFMKVLSMPVNKHTREALELLGVARERNQQTAHAKAIYAQYLKQYPEGEGTDRVRQRYADLVGTRLAPKQKLGDGQTAEEEYRSELQGAWSQYFYFGEIYNETSTDTEQNFLISQLSLNQRIRSDNLDMRNSLSLDHEHDILNKESGSAEINNLYSKLKYVPWQLHVAAGRQSALTAGILGRFDGVVVGRDLGEKVRLNVYGGYPVDISDKSEIQTNKKFLGMNVELNDYIQDWHITPYYLQQTDEGMQDRQVIGTELRYFKDGSNAFSIIDYDTLFDELNIFSLRAQHAVTENTSAILTLDYRKNPPLELSNALIGDNQVESLGDLRATLSEDEIRQRAKDRTSDVSTVTLGMTHSLTGDTQINADVTLSQQNVKSPDNSVTEQKDKQAYYNVQVVISKLLNSNDVGILNLRGIQTDQYDELQATVSHRITTQSKLRIESRLLLSNNENDNGETQRRAKPTLKFDYRSKHNVNYLFELNYEWWNYSGATNNNDFERSFINFGYQWLF